MALLASLHAQPATAVPVCVAVSSAYTNSGTISCATVTSTSFTGNVSNAGVISPAGISLTSGTITGSIIDSGTISATPGSYSGILIDSASIISKSSGAALDITGPTFTGGISSAGTISAGNNAIIINTVSTFSGGISNAGTISASADNGIDVYSTSTFSGGITNSGTISAGYYGFNVDLNSVFSGGIVNSTSGTIAAGHTGIIVGYTSTFSGGISNSGTISSASAGIELTGIAQFGSTGTPGSISNSGTISGGGISISGSTITGQIADSGIIQATSGNLGILVDHASLINDSGGAAISITGPTFAGDISNAGTLSGNTGILVNGTSTFSGAITNAGTISVGAYGIKVSNVAQFGSSASGGIVNSGTINGGTNGIWVDVTNFSGGITNSGTISAAGNDTTSNHPAIYVLGGTFSGGILNTGTIIDAKTDAMIINDQSFSGGITNTGTMSVWGHVIGVRNQTLFSGGITNSGQLISTSFDGILVGKVTTFSGGIINSATGTISALGGTCLDGCADGISLANISQFSGGVSNAGTITAARTGILLTAGVASRTYHGITTFSGGITNSGSISATLVGISINAVSTFQGNLSNAGAISAETGILLSYKTNNAGQVSNSEVSIFQGIIANSGTISASSYGIQVSNVAQFGSTSAGGGIVNTGTIVSGGAGIYVAMSSFVGQVTNSGTISAATGIIVSDGVSVFDSGTIMGTGGTAIDFTGSSHALTLAPGYSIAGNVVASGSGTLNLGGTSGSASFNLGSIGTQYTGFSSFYEVGNVTWTLTGSGGQAWTVEGGTLRGVGTIGGAIVEGAGTLEPGTSSAIGALHIAGNLTQAASSSYASEVSPSAADEAIVTGTATVAGSLTVNADPGTYATGANYTLLNAAGGLAGTFSLTTFNGSFGEDVIPEISYDPNDVILTIASGASGLTISSGTEVLNGVYDYTGPTTVGSGGTLILGAGASLPNSSAIVDSGTLSLSGANSSVSINSLTGSGGVSLGSNTLVLTGANDTFAGVITGTGGVALSGGTETLSGNSTYTGPTTITQATLELSDASIASSPVTVGSGGRLGGTGTTGPVTLAGGTLSPGDAIGILHINGPLSFASGTKYALEIAPAQNDEAIVTGSTSIANGTTLALSPDPGTYTAGTVYTLLNSAGGVSGTFTTVTFGNGFSSNVFPVISYGLDDVFLTLRPSLQCNATNAPAANQLAACSTIANAGFNSGLYGATAALTATAGVVQPALAQMAGEIHASLRSVMIEDGRIIRDTVINHAIQGNGEITVWSSGFDGYGTIDGNGNAGQVEHNDAGVIFGADVPAGYGFNFGLDIAFTGQGVHVPSVTASATGTTNHVMGYANWAGGPLVATLGWDYGWGANQIVRQITALSETDGDHQSNRLGQVFGEVGYRFSSDIMNLEPYFDLANVLARTSSFNEIGGLAALEGGAQVNSENYATVGMRAMAPGIPLGDTTMVPKFNLGWQHAFTRFMPNQSLLFAGTGQMFMVSGVPLDNNAAAIEGTFDFDLASEAILSIGYDGQVSSTVQNHAVRAEFSWKF